MIMWWSSWKNSLSSSSSSSGGGSSNDVGEERKSLWNRGLGGIMSSSLDGDGGSGSGSNSVAASPFWALNSVVPSNKSKGEGEGLFSPFVAFCFAINYILGTGFLTIPWAFVHGGLLLSALLLMTVCWLADASKNYVLETMAWAEAMLDPHMTWNPAPSTTNTNTNTNTTTNGLVYSPKLLTRQHSLDLETNNNNNSSTNSGGYYDSLGSTTVIPASEVTLTPQARFQGRRLLTTTTTRAAAGSTGRQLKGVEYVVKDRKFEVNTLCRVFLGKPGLHIYTLCISLYIYGALWAYTSVFASSMSEALPLFDQSNYGWYTLMFAIIVIPMSCLELDEQVAVQVTLTGCRFLMVFLMIFTSYTCAQDTGLSTTNTINNNTNTEAPMVQLSNLHQSLPILVFATIFHHSIPGLSHPVANKQQLSGIFLSTGVFSGVAYCIIGFVLGSAFGTNIQQSSNLNWKGYRGGTGILSDDGITYIHVAPWAKAISSFLLTFPALDVVSAFPLCAITLGNNLMGAFHGKNIHEIENNRWKVIQFRLMACIPPLIGGYCVRQLGVITDYAGTTGFAITFCFPAILFIYAQKEAIQRKFKTTTYYTSYASSPKFAMTLNFFGITMVAYVLTQLLQE